MKIWIQALRVRQWNKQTLVILPLIALGDAIRLTDLVQLILVALSFSFIASAVYIFNDLQDLKSDRLDPIKSKRPLANGNIAAPQAKLVGVLLLSSGCLIPFVTLDVPRNSMF